MLFGAEYEWDESKSAENVEKHEGVGFEEATTVFNDPAALYVYDADHSDNEDRYIVVGIGDRRRTIVVTYTYRSDRIRIISARKAEPRERRQYSNAKKDL